MSTPSAPTADGWPCTGMAGSSSRRRPGRPGCTSSAAVVSPGLAFAPDSRTAVYDDNAGTLILAEVETGRELAPLRGPGAGADPDVRVAFTPDGSHLVTTFTDRPYLRVWDLRAIRRRLAELGLDWDPPASFDTPNAPGSLPPIPKPFRVDRGQLDSWLSRGPSRPSRSWSGRPARSKLTPTTPRPITNAATRWPGWGDSTRPSPTSPRR